MKIHHLVVWPGRWSATHCSQGNNTPVVDGILLDFCLWEGTSKITLVVQRPDGKYYGSIRTTRDVYPYLLEFLEKNKGRRLEDILQTEVTLAGWIH